MRPHHHGRRGRTHARAPHYIELEPAKPKVILCVAASDAHVVANHLIAIHLADNGYEVVNLGAATPIDELMEAAQIHSDAIAILIGSLNGHAVDDLAGLAEQKRLYQVRSKVIVGGNLSVGALKTDEAAQRLLADGVDLLLRDVSELLPVLADIASERQIAPLPPIPAILAQEFQADAQL